MSSLDEIERSYKRALEGFLHLQNDALDDGDQPRFERIETQIDIMNSGFVVVIFGRIEAGLRNVFAAKLRKSRTDGRPTDAEIDQIFRSKGFDVMVEEILGKGHALVRPVSSWYNVRGDIAHGRGTSRRYDVFQLFEHARGIEAAIAITLGMVTAAQPRSGGTAPSTTKGQE